MATRGNLVSCRSAAQIAGSIRKHSLTKILQSAKRVTSHPLNFEYPLQHRLSNAELATSPRYLQFPVPTMVYYFQSTAVTPPAFIYVGKDKVESMIRFHALTGKLGLKMAR